MTAQFIKEGDTDIMKNTVEIRWHGRGGQGAKTAALLLADVAFKTGICAGISGIWPGTHGGADHGIQQDQQ